MAVSRDTNVNELYSVCSNPESSAKEIRRAFFNLASSLDSLSGREAIKALDIVKFKLIVIQCFTALNMLDDKIKILFDQESGKLCRFFYCTLAEKLDYNLLVNPNAEMLPGITRVHEILLNNLDPAERNPNTFIASILRAFKLNYPDEKAPKPTLKMLQEVVKTLFTDTDRPEDYYRVLFQALPKLFQEQTTALQAEFTELQTQMATLKATIASEQTKVKEFEEKGLVRKGLAVFRETRRDFGLTTEEKGSEKRIAKATREGCKVYLMEYSEPKFYKDSNKTHLYLYEDSEGILTYHKDGMKFYLNYAWGKEDPLYKAIKAAQLSFNQLKDNPQPCTHIAIVVQILANTSKREKGQGNTYGLGREDLIKKHQNDLEALKAKEKNLQEIQEDLLRQQSDILKQLKIERDQLAKPLEEKQPARATEVKETVVTLHLASQPKKTIFSNFSTYPFLERGLQSDQAGKVTLNSEDIEKILDKVPETTLLTLFNIEGKAVLLHSIFEIKDEDLLKKNLQKFIIDDFVKIAREKILTADGKLDPDLIAFLDAQSPDKKFSEKYDALSPADQERVKNNLIFSLANAGIRMTLATYAMQIGRSETQVKKYYSFQEDIDVRDLIHNTIDPMSKPSIAVRVTTTPASLFAGSLSLSQVAKDAHELTELCKRKVVEAFDVSFEKQVEIMSTYSNRITQHVQDTILVMGSTAEMRAEKVAYWINIANECFNQNDFHTAQAIHGALLSQPIFRLHDTFELLSDITKIMFAILQEKCTPDQLKTEAIKQIKSGSTDAIPFYGMAQQLTVKESEFHRLNKMNQENEVKKPNLTLPPEERETLDLYNDAYQKIKEKNAHLKELPFRPLQQTIEQVLLPSRDKAEAAWRERVKLSEELEAKKPKQAPGTGNRRK